MDYEYRLISIYLFICKHWDGVQWHCMRYSNYTDLSFTDEEAIAIYLFCVTDGRRTIKEICEYADRHFRAFFPLLPGYKAFDARLNKICDAFVPLMAAMENDGERAIFPEGTTNVTDAMPIVMAQRGRRFSAKVAPEIATGNGYCATKKMHYYGVKLHVVGARRKGVLPLPHKIGLADAGTHDLKAYAQVEPEIYHDVFADKAYQTEGSPVREAEKYTLYTPPKKEKGQTLKDAADDLLGTAISKVRQPIESFFNWINEKTGIQVASKVRSYNGLMTHVFGKLAAAYLLIFKII